VNQDSQLALDVWLDGSVVAELTMNRRRVPQLRYRLEYVERRGEGALGLTIPLPVTSQPYRGDLVDHWIEGLLPEGETRTVLERYFRVRRGDGFGLLRAIGRDCAGAVAILPPGQALGDPHRTPLPMTTDEVAEAVTSLRQHPLGVDDETRVSLGGLQSKLLLIQTPDGWARPLSGFPSTHILKPDPPEFPGLVAAEAFAQRAAALAGLAAAECRLDSFGGRTVLVVKRFDRAERDGRLRRIHQEDGCQALGVDPSLGKYQALDGAASYRKLAAVLQTYAADGQDELRKLAALMTFTIAIGNTDAHLRNHAFLHAGDTIRLAPVFDAAPTAEFAGTRQLALWIDDQSLLSIVTRGHLLHEAIAWGLPEDAAGHVIETTLSSLADAYPEAAASVPRVPTAMVAACARRTTRLLRQS